MTTFSDDFNRADGELGSNWSVTYGNMTISSHQVASTGYGWARCLGGSDSGNSDNYVTVYTPVGTTVAAAIGCKLDSTLVQGYVANLAGSAGALTGTLVRILDGPSVTLWSGTLPTGATAYTILRLQYDSGYVRLYCNGTLVANVADSTWAAQPSLAMHLENAATRIAGFNWAPAASRTLTVTPDPLWVGGGTQLVTLTGYNTSWTPGEPGSTTVTVDHGTIDFQRVLSATEVEVYYTPAEYSGPITFTESEYGLSDEVLGVVVMPAGYGSFECLLTPEGASLINDTAAETPLTKRLFARNSYVGVAPVDVTYQEVIQYLAQFLINNGWSTQLPPNETIGYIFRWIGGDFLPTMPTPLPPTQTTLKEDLAAVLSSFGDVQGPGGVTLATLAAALSDLRGVGGPSLADVLSAVSAADNSDVLAYLSAMRGNEVVTLLQVVSQLSNLSTINGYDLGTIVDRLDDRPTNAALAAYMLELNGALGGLALEIAGLYKGLGLIEATSIFDTISGIIGDLFSGLGSTLVDQFLDKILNPSSGSALTVTVPPVWPGASHVNLGLAVALDRGVTIDSPMDGVLVQITGVAPKLNGHAYTYDDTLCYRNVGALAFYTDSGDLETYQALGFTSAIYVPRYMARAGGVKVMTPAGTSGTVQPWTAIR